jgi:hypothetical protein
MWRYVLHFVIRTGELTTSSSNSGPNSATDKPGHLPYVTDRVIE